MILLSQSNPCIWRRVSVTEMDTETRRGETSDNSHKKKVSQRKLISHGVNNENRALNQEWT